MAQSAALLLDLPLRDGRLLHDRTRSGRGGVLRLYRSTKRPVVNNTLVSAGFAQTMGIPLKSGRMFDSHDSVRSAGMSVTNSGAVSGVPVVVNGVCAENVSG